jgi:hypothetical protein
VYQHMRASYAVKTMLAAKWALLLCVTASSRTECSSKSQQ